MCVPYDSHPPRLSIKDKIKSPSSARALYHSQVRPSRPPKGDSDAQWSHDLYEDPDKPSLSSRLSASAAAPRKPDSALVQRAIREATAAGGISIKGASTTVNGNVVQVDGLVKGTTPADVEVCLFFSHPSHFLIPDRPSSGGVAQSSLPTSGPTKHLTT